MKISTLFVPIVTLSLVAACGGGSGGSGGSVADAGNDIVNTVPDTTAATGAGTDASSLLTGRFVDSAVSGLQYTTATQSGLTGADGSFTYQSGETITFSIGDITLPAIAAAEILTPMSVFSTDELTDIRVMNLARLLQTLDTDGDLQNGITLSEAATASASGLNVNFSSAAFDAQVGNLVANSGSVNVELVDGIDALDHLQETLFQEGLDERPPMPTEQSQTPIEAQGPATHPLVGSSAEFSNFSHGISGTLTVIDDRTLEVSNFNYDAGGIEVFFYTGVGGNFRNGVAIGPQLNGRAAEYVNETIRLTIPDGLTLDDFDSLSVWCVPFGISFGDAQLRP